MEDRKGGRESGGGVIEWRVIVKELKSVSYMAAPMVAVTVSMQLLQVVSMMMVGHLGALSLSGVAIATSLANATGFSLLFGLAGGLETLCGQAYGAQQYPKVGAYTYSAIITLLTMCVPISILWLFMENILIAIGQDPEIANVACRYSMWLIPALFGYAVLEALVRYFQSQGLIFPLFLTSAVTLCVHFPLCWILIYKFKFGIIGAACAIGFSYWFNAILLLIVMRYSSACEKTRTFCFGDVCACTKEFLSFALPSAIMVCLEWWSFELLILLSGLLPNSKLETSVLSICLTTTSLHYFMPYAIGAAASTRVANELGAGHPQPACVTARVVMVLAVAEAAIVSITLFCVRSIWGYLYSSDAEVVESVTRITPLLCLSVIMDSLVAVLSGVARGSGWQSLGAYLNLGAYYVVGIPLAVVLCFVLNLGGKGLWIGILTGSTMQALLLAVVTSFTDWRKQAMKARERIFEGKTPLLGNELA